MVSPKVHSEYRSYKIIEDDFLTICEFIEPCDANLPTYSHRIYELFLRACTEFEGAAKEMLIEKKYEKALKEPNSLNIKDYKKLYSEYHHFWGANVRAEVGLLFWKGGNKFIEPLGDWKLEKPLGWYRDYNAVKHNRQNEFQKATFGNLVCAVASVFLFRMAQQGDSFFQPFRTSGGSSSSSNGERYASGCIFSIKNPVER